MVTVAHEDKMKREEEREINRDESKGPERAAWTRRGGGEATMGQEPSRSVG